MGDYISDRIASYVAIPYAFLIICASPVFDPKKSSTFNLPSIQESTASFLERGEGRFPYLGALAYSSFADSILFNSDIYLKLNYIRYRDS